MLSICPVKVISRTAKLDGFKKKWNSICISYLLKVMPKVNDDDCSKNPKNNLSHDHCNKDVSSKTVEYVSPKNAQVTVPHLKHPPVWKLLLDEHQGDPFFKAHFIHVQSSFPKKNASLCATNPGHVSAKKYSEPVCSTFTTTHPLQETFF